jgi:hypothetical protein
MEALVVAPQHNDDPYADLPIKTTQEASTGCRSASIGLSKSMK